MERREALRYLLEQAGSFYITMLAAGRRPSAEPISAYMSRIADRASSLFDALGGHTVHEIPDAVRYFLRSAAAIEALDDDGPRGLAASLDGLAAIERWARAFSSRGAVAQQVPELDRRRGHEPNIALDRWFQALVAVYEQVFELRPADGIHTSRGRAEPFGSFVDFAMAASQAIGVPMTRGSVRERWRSQFGDRKRRAKNQADGLI
jgi:hypothetical protein